MRAHRLILPFLSVTMLVPVNALIKTTEMDASGRTPERNAQRDGRGCVCVCVCVSCLSQCGGVRLVGQGQSSAEFLDFNLRLASRPPEAAAPCNRPVNDRQRQRRMGAHYGYSTSG